MFLPVRAPYVFWLEARLEVKVCLLQDGRLLFHVIFVPLCRRTWMDFNIDAHRPCICTFTCTLCTGAVPLLKVAGRYYCVRCCGNAQRCGQPSLQKVTLHLTEEPRAQWPPWPLWAFQVPVACRAHGSQGRGAWFGPTLHNDGVTWWICPADSARQTFFGPREVSDSVYLLDDDFAD